MKMKNLLKMFLTALREMAEEKQQFESQEDLYAEETIYKKVYSTERYSFIS